VPSPDSDARVSEAGVLMNGLSIRSGADHGAAGLSRRAT
jgi:hypothetical protein